MWGIFKTTVFPFLFTAGLIAMYLVFFHRVSDLLLWAIGLMFFVAGDPITTALAVSKSGIEEGNAVVRWLLGPEPGLPGMLILHVLIVPLAGFLYLLQPNNPYTGAIPVALIGMGLYPTGLNLYHYYWADPD